MGGAGAAGTGGAGTNHGASGDYTVFLPSESDHYPGDMNSGNASIQHRAIPGDAFDGTPSPKGYEAAGFLIIGNEDVTFGDCSTENTAAFGLDRENDDSGTKTDESLLAARENSQFKEHEIVIDFFDQGDLAGEPISINAVDEIVAVQNQCYTMPSEPGWYQINGFLNGTGYNGNEFDVTLDSHYFYVCECGSEEEARQQLGPPPSEEGSSGGSESTATPEPTATAEATATATAEATATATATPESTATATPESTATATAESTATATAEATATATPESTATAADDGGDGSGGGNDGAGDGAGSGGDGDSTATRTAAPGGAGQGPATPTVGAGPGFGAAAALVGMLAAALLAFRRD